MIIVPLTKGKVTIINDRYLPLIRPYKWTASKSNFNWYAKRSERVNGRSKTIYMHRVIMGTAKGRCVHHKDGDSLNNLRNNLVDCSRAYNSHLKRKAV